MFSTLIDEGIRETSGGHKLHHVPVVYIPVGHFKDTKSLHHSLKCIHADLLHD